MNIFFSWQSDSENKTNRGLIEKALKAAISDLPQEIPGLVYDEAMARVPGAQNIVSKIFEKIAESKVFVADVSIVHRNEIKGKKRSSCNPNVLFELGFAVAYLGWERIILVFNEEQGESSELPFDLDKSRLTCYKHSSGYQALSLKLRDAIRLIFERAPENHAVVWRNDIKRVQRQKTVRTIKRICKSLHLNTLNDFLYEMPYKFPKAMNSMMSGIRDAFRPDLFDMHDERLETILKDFIIPLDDICRSSGPYYSNLPLDLDDHFYHLNYPDTQDAEVFQNIIRDIDHYKSEIEPKLTLVQQNLGLFFNHIKLNYALEVDVIQDVATSPSGYFDE